MKLAVMQPYFFPYLGYFQLFHAADKVILYDNVKFIRCGWIHRNRILEIGKGPRFVGLPLDQSSCQNRIRDVKVAAVKDWKTPIMHLLRHNYCHSPYFHEVIQIVDAALDVTERSVSKLAKSSIRAVLAYLDSSTPVMYDSLVFDFLEEELGGFAGRTPGARCGEDPTGLKKERMLTRVEALCHHEGASIYINPIGGVDLYSKTDFEALGIELRFLSPQLLSYPQNSPEFIASLSIIDVLMNAGKENTKKMLSSYSFL